MEMTLEQIEAVELQTMLHHDPHKEMLLLALKYMIATGHLRMKNPR